MWISANSYGEQPNIACTEPHLDIKTHALMSFYDNKIMKYSTILITEVLLTKDYSSGNRYIRIVKSNKWWHFLLFDNRESRVLYVAPANGTNCSFKFCILCRSVVRPSSSLTVSMTTTSSQRKWRPSSSLHSRTGGLMSLSHVELSRTGGLMSLSHWELSRTVGLISCHI